MKFSPTEEQEKALQLFKKGDTLKIDAYAGAGKTTTLIYLAQSQTGRGHYLAFNKSIADDARNQFPETVRCTTTHSLAYGFIKRRYGYSDDKLTGRANANLIGEVLQLPAIGHPDSTKKLTLSDRSYGAILRTACNRFLYSSDLEPLSKHFPRCGKLAGLNDAEFNAFTQEALPKLRKLWADMRDSSTSVPLGHDGYLKLWALSSPKISAEYIMLDEAQDSNPALLGVLADQKSQVIYVGDPYQQIYEWRGAINAMNQVHAPNRTSLTQAFRFGPSIANAAFKVIASLGASEPIRGNPEIQSEICSVYPQAILCRTNAGVFSRLISHLSNKEKCYILGGTAGLERFLEDVQRLKNGHAGHLPEFFGFANWAEIVDFTELPEGEELRSWVNLISEHGEARLLSALRQCQGADEGASVIISTTHKAKGKQWKTVTVDSDFEFFYTRWTTFDDQSSFDREIFEAEARVLYVAMTRARKAVELPPAIMAYFGLQKTRRGKIHPSEKHTGLWQLIKSIFREK
jgi:hypothetical protein